jgi:UDP-sugar pyrophosphorylase
VNPFDDYKPSEPEGVFLRPGSAEFSEMEQLGINELSKLCFVVIAGGLGERLGYSGIKISLPVVIIDQDYSYMKFYCQYVLACETRARAIDPSLPESFHVPLGIMVSDDTNDRTIALLEANNYFGLKKEHVSIMKQENVPAMIDNNAKLALDENGLISTKPHGHGDIHNLLFDSGVACRWLDIGKEWMVFLQDTNALAVKAIPSVLGVSRKLNLEMNSVCVQRKPGEAMGAIVKLTKEDGSG